MNIAVTPTIAASPSKRKAQPALLLKGIVALLLCAGLVIFCYYHVDKPVAFWVHHQQLRQQAHFLNYFTFIPNVVVMLVPCIYVVFVFAYILGSDRHFMRVMLALANSVVIAIFLKTGLKIIFGRYWPETWIGKNPSLIKNNVYGFHFYRMGSAYGSFPSGHTTVIVAAMGVLWFVYPKLRLFCLLMIVLVVAGLIGMNYHFVGDAVGGAFLGGLTAYYTVIISRLNREG